MRIDLLADHVDLVPLIARWHYDEWSYYDPERPLEDWTSRVAEMVNRDRIPIMFVAMEGDTLVGTASLVEFDMATRADLSPWLAGVFVDPESRGQGTGTALVRRVIDCAADLGVSPLYLFTNGAEPLYERLGWKTFSSEHYRDRMVTIMTRPN